VIGQPKESAIATLQALGFVVDAADVVEEFNAAPAGTVWDQSPAPDSKFPKGTRITLRVSKGLEQAGVPYVVDKTKADAIDALIKAGFKVKSVNKASDTVAKGTVTDQKPAGGDAAAKGSTVTIYVSSGKPQVTVPTLIGLTQGAAEAKLTALGLVASVTPIPDPDPSKTGIVKDQLPAAGTKVDKGSTVTIGVYTTP
jgi:serine/threonine-protein kinase